MALSDAQLANLGSRIIRPGTGALDQASAANTRNYNWIVPQPVKPAAPAGDPWWMNGLNGLGASGKLFTNTVANWTDGQLNWKDIPFADSIAHAAKNQWAIWHDGKFAPDDLNIIKNALVDIGKNGKGFDQTLDNVGWKQAEADPTKGWNPFVARKGQFDVHDLVSFIGDAGLDPVTYATLGGASALKAGASASIKTAKSLAEEAGIQASRKSVNTLPSQIFDQTVSKFKDTPVNQSLAERLASKKFMDAQTAIENAGKAARNKAQNAAVSFDIPLTKITKQFGSKPDFLKIADGKIGNVGAGAVSELLAKSGVPLAAHSNLLEKVFGKTNAEDLTLQELKHLQEQTKGFKNPFTANNGEAKNFLNGHNIQEDLVKRVEPNPNFNPVDMNLHVGSNYQEPFNITEDLLRKVEAKPYAPNSIDKLRQDITKFTQDSGGQSSLGKKLPQVFNPRSFGSKDPLVNQAANSLRDAETQGIGQAAQLGQVLKGFSTDMKGLTDTEKRDLIYLVEGAAPAGKALSTDPKLLQVAGKLKSYLQGVGAQDLKAGTISDLRQNYFPHVINPDPERMARLQEAFKNDPAMLSKFAGRSASNSFGKQRTSFDNFAQLDDAVAKLETGYQGAVKAGDTAAAEQISQTINDMQNLFQGDPLKAVAERGYKSIKSRAMAELHTKLQADGLLKIHTPENSAGELRLDPNDFHTLTRGDITSLGIKVPDNGVAYMHKEVYEGLQKMNTIFSDKGTQKIFEKMNEVVGIWKNLVTTSVPAHYINNFIGNIANNTMAGVGIKQYVEAGSLLKKAKNFEKLTSDETRTMQELFDKGVIGGHGQNSEFVKSAIDFKGTGKLAKVSEFAANNMWSRFLRKNLGENVDSFTRAALYLHGKELTGSADKAAEMVRKYLFNYNELTNADKNVRAFVPFWNWTKHNLPLQIQHLATEPRFAQTYLRFKDALQGDSGGNTPDWVHEAYLKVPGTDKTYFNPRLPISDLNQLGGPIKDIESIMGMLNPVMKAPIELAANHQFFSGKPIDYNKNKTGSYDPAAIGKYLLSQTGIVGKAANIIQNPTDPLSYLNLILGKPVTLK